MNKIPSSEKSTLLDFQEHHHQKGGKHGRSLKSNKPTYMLSSQSKKDSDLDKHAKRRRLQEERLLNYPNHTAITRFQTVSRVSPN